jgi:hypothetical protein
VNADVLAAVCVALRSGAYHMARPGYLARGIGANGRPAAWEPLGVLCDLQVAAGVIPPPTPLMTGGEVVWLFRDTPDGQPYAATLPPKVLEMAEMTLTIGDPFEVAGTFRPWTAHAEKLVPFRVFAQELEAHPPAPIPKGALTA